jgi:hypothetical protein
MKKIAQIAPVLIVSFTVLVPTSAQAWLCEGTLEEKVDCLNEKLRYVLIDVDAGGKPLIKVMGANVQIVRGGARTGNLIVGSGHTWTKATESFVAGYANTIASMNASVCGGSRNKATGYWSSISGGYGNQASSYYASVSGGRDNKATNYGASISGGLRNTASGIYTSVSGGRINQATACGDSVSGGLGNIASGIYASVSGGIGNKATAQYSSVSGGRRRSIGVRDVQAWRAGALFQKQ